MCFISTFLVLRMVEHFDGRLIHIWCWSFWGSRTRTGWWRWCLLMLVVCFHHLFLLQCSHVIRPNPKAAVLVGQERREEGEKVRKMDQSSVSGTEVTAAPGGLGSEGGGEETDDGRKERRSKCRVRRGDGVQRKRGRRVFVNRCPVVLPVTPQLLLTRRSLAARARASFVLTGRPLPPLWHRVQGPATESQSRTRRRRVDAGQTAKEAKNPQKLRDERRHI